MRGLPSSCCPGLVQAAAANRRAGGGGGGGAAGGRESACPKHLLRVFLRMLKLPTDPAMLTGIWVEHLIPHPLLVERSAVHHSILPQAFSIIQGVKEGIAVSSTWTREVQFEKPVSA